VLDHKKINAMISIRLVVLVVFVMVTSCSTSEPVKIGFIAGLTGRVASLGTAGRDGALLAVEEANTQGGINGRKIEMITRDDKQNEEKCKLAITELVAEDVVGIIGPMTSAMALDIVPVINEHAIPTISPTVSTGLLAGIDDYFFRIIPVSSDAAVMTAAYAYNEKNYRKLLVVYDISNSGYTSPWFEKLKTHFEKFDSGKVESLSYTSESGYDFLEIARKISEMDMDCLVILANSLDIALLSQQLAKLQIKTPILASEWSLTDELIEFGGEAVEGIELFHSFDPNSKKQSYLDFNLKFQKRFGYVADFASAYGYNAMKILIGSLKKSNSADQVRKTIVNDSPYQGVQHEVRFNDYGDAIREYSLLKIENGKILTL
jgi:branched-chain amino acid transport system substrate-binding protein